MQTIETEKVDIWQWKTNKLNRYVAANAATYDGQKPIYEILMIENPDKELIYPTGKHSGFPDTGSTCYVGFYYDLADAIRAVKENWCDLRETVYNAGFILCHFPGLYESTGREGRIYFVWDEEEPGYRIAEEPKIFTHVAY